MIVKFGTILVSSVIVLDNDHIYTPLSGRALFHSVVDLIDDNL